MNKKVVLISSVLLTFGVIISSIVIITKNNTNNEIINNKKEIVNNSFLTLMLEQEDGTYLESTSNTWPGEGYIFNKELSACQNGGELDYDSEENKVILYNNKSDGCYIYFDIYTKPIINSINLVETTNNSITINISTTTGTNPITNYYYIINNNTPVSTTSNSYIFSGLDSGTTYNIEVYVIDSLGYESNRATLSVETSNPPTTLAEACSDGENLASCITSFYNQSGTYITNIYYHNSSLANGAGDNSYRYAGASDDVNNYICFGSTASTCPSDNLYRIIGVFGDQVKLIMADYPTTSQTGTGGAYSTTYTNSEENTTYYKGSQNLSSVGTYYWNPSGTNTWSESNLNTTNLNTTFLNTFSSTYRNKIADATWYVNGYSSSAGTPAEFQDAESTGTYVTAKIGLMYVSDYGFAASPSYWTASISLYDSAIFSNWMYMGLQEWTISRISNTTYTAYFVYYIGRVGRTTVNIYSYPVRPVFYLTSNVAYTGGIGTESDPIRVN